MICSIKVIWKWTLRHKEQTWLLFFVSLARATVTSHNAKVGECYSCCDVTLSLSTVFMPNSQTKLFLSLFCRTRGNMKSRHSWWVTIWNTETGISGVFTSHIWMEAPVLIWHFCSFVILYRRSCSIETQEEEVEKGDEWSRWYGRYVHTHVSSDSTCSSYPNLEPLIHLDLKG